MSSAFRLSKKTALAGLQCHKRLWWERHDRGAMELRESAAVRYRLREGAAVGALARAYVPGGVLIGASSARDWDAQDALLDETRAVMAIPSVPALYEGAFADADVIVYTDILQRAPDGWTLIEVKSSTSISAAEHLLDVAVQACVLRAAGVGVARYEVMHLDRACRHPDLSNLFVREDVTDQVRAMMDDVARRMAELPSALDLAAAPDVAIGEHCLKPRECPFLSRCWPPLPAHHVRTLYKIGKKADGFVANGWETIPQLPEQVKLSAIAARQRRSVRNGEIVVERDALVSALSALARPVAHLDFETVQPAIPCWEGCRPYDQVPVQLSCHVVAADGSTTHHAWLFDGEGDPRPEAARAILDACRGARTVTAYFSSFEKQCIKLVAAACPEHAAELGAIAGSLVDLLPIVREHVYHPEFAGSFSLKKVLPALVPTLSYRGLRIAEGETAQLELSRLIFERGTISREERAELRAALLAYCELDTRAMVELEARLHTLANAD
jgi:hypothetical protein